MKTTGKRGRERRAQRGSERRGPLESRIAEATTVGWMLTTAMTLLADLGLVAAWFIVSRGDEQTLPEAVTVLPSLLLFTATITGILGLSLVPAVYFLRRQRPPWQITATAIGVGLFPLVWGGILAL